jgi:hypothetical protein
MRLQCLHKTAKAGRREISVDGSEIERGHGRGARFVSLCRENNAREPGQNARLM